MKKKKFNLGETNIMIGLTIIVMAYWCCQICLHYFMFPNSDIYSHVFGSNLFEQASRLIVFCFFALFMSHLQYVVKMRRQAEKEAKANEYKTAEKILELGKVTELSNSIVVPKFDWATTTSAPKIKFINCCVKILIPKVAKIEINKSLFTTR